jgi:hypothetical protein
MLGWIRRIRVRRINLLGLELELADRPDAGGRNGHPRMGNPAVSPLGSESGIDGPTTRVSKSVPAGMRFTAHGTVIRTVGRDLGVRVRNEAEIRNFWRVNEIDTKLDWFDSGPPVVSIGRARDIARCRVGDEASITFVVVDRPTGKRGIRTIDFEVSRDT